MRKRKYEDVGGPDRMKIILDLPDTTKLLFVNCVFTDKRKNILIDGFGFGPSEMRDGNTLRITAPDTKKEAT